MQGDKCCEEITLRLSGSLWELVRVPDPGRIGRRPEGSILGKILKDVTAELNPKG